MTFNFKIQVSPCSWWCWTGMEGALLSFPSTFTNKPQLSSRKTPISKENGKKSGYIFVRFLSANKRANLSHSFGWICWWQRLPRGSRWAGSLPQHISHQPQKPTFAYKAIVIEPAPDFLIYWIFVPLDRNSSNLPARTNILNRVF